MKRISIIGAVWSAIIIGLISFGATVFFLDNENKKNHINNSYSGSSNKNNQIVFLTNESSVRTNNFANAETEVIQNKVTNESKLNKNNQNTNTQNFLNENTKNEIVVDEEDINNIFFDDKKNLIKNDYLYSNKKSEETVESLGKNINSFVRPVKGEIIKPLSIDELIFSETLHEWNIHTGTDYKAQIGEEVYAVRSGKIKEINFNYIYGNYIIIEHDEGYQSLYANITVLDALKVGNVINQGQLIGYIAESSGFESAEETHLHFELKKYDEYLAI